MNKKYFRSPLLCSLLALSPTLLAARGCALGSEDVPLGSNGEGGEAASLGQAGHAAAGRGGTGGSGGTSAPTDDARCIEQLTPLEGSDSTAFGFTTGDVWSLIDGKHVATQFLIGPLDDRLEGGTSPVEFYMVEAELFHVDSERNPDFNLDIPVECNDHVRARGIARFVSADGSFDETFPDFELDVGSTLTDGPGDVVARMTAGGVINLAKDALRGNYQPALGADQCFLAMQFNVTLTRTQFTGSFIRSVLNAPCGNDEPDAAVHAGDAGTWGCRAGSECGKTEPHVAVVVEADSCDAIGPQLTQAGDEETFSLEVATLSREDIWLAGCWPAVPEYVLAYSPSSPVDLRLCHNDTAKSCVLLPPMSGELSYDLGTAFEAAGTTEFRFVD
jgi:hypothetical protein